MEDSLIIVIAFIFGSAVIFNLLGFTLEKPRNLIGYVISAMLWMTLAVVFPSLTDLPYPHLSWAFLLIGGVDAIVFMVESVGMMYYANKDDWEKEEEEWET